MDEVIFRYTREQAIEDGVLIDVSETAKEAGIKFPVAVSVGLWEERIKPTEVEEGFGQSMGGRLWDVLWMFRVFARNTPGPIMHYEVIFATQRNDTVKQETVELKAVIGPGDEGEPVITIMLPWED